jgi:Ser/Thr protein kinase RdoA (MazF antagonist)
MNLVHGFDGGLSAPDWPPLELGELRAVLPAREVLWRSPRPLSAAALVRTTAGPVFVKRHAEQVRDLAALAEEHAFARHLRAAGAPVPEVLDAVQRGPWTYEVHAVGAGEDRYRDVLSWQPFASLADARAAGSALARLSTCAEGFAAPARPPRLLVSGWQGVTADGLRAHLAARPAVRAALDDRLPEVERTLAPLQERLAPHLAGLPSGWTHGDGHASNLLWSGAAVTAVLDLGLADRTTPVLDLATAVERNAVSWLSPSPTADLALVDALVRGWHAARPLSSAERPALPELLPLVHVDFALSELAYFAHVVRSPDNARLALDGYLLRHARWFGSPPGRRLLDHLRRSLAALPDAGA